MSDCAQAKADCAAICERCASKWLWPANLSIKTLRLL